MKVFKNPKTVKVLVCIAIAGISIAAFMIYFHFTSTKSLSKEHEHDEAAEAHLSEKEEQIVKISHEDIDKFKIKVEEALPGKIRIERTYTGEIRSDQDKLAQAVPPYPGIVRAVKKKLGDIVEAEETLAIIHSNDTLVDYELKSDLKGIIVGRYLTLGEFLDGSNPAYEIADLSSVWVNISIFQKDLPFIQKGKKAVILDVQTRNTSAGIIGYIDPLINEKTRNGLARIYLSNEDYYWKPGMFITARVAIKESAVPVAIKRSALQLVDDKTAVFVEQNGGFVARDVTTGLSDSVNIAIHEGLNVGDRYVSESSFVLKAELQKEELSDGHGH